MTFSERASISQPSRSPPSRCSRWPGAHHRLDLLGGCRARAGRIERHGGRAWRTAQPGQRRTQARPGPRRGAGPWPPPRPLAPARLAPSSAASAVAQRQEGQQPVGRRSGRHEFCSVAIGAQVPPQQRATESSSPAAPATAAACRLAAAAGRLRSRRSARPGRIDDLRVAVAGGHAGADLALEVEGQRRVRVGQRLVWQTRQRSSAVSACRRSASTSGAWGGRGHRSAQPQQQRGAGAARAHEALPQARQQLAGDDLGVSAPTWRCRITPWASITKVSGAP